MRETAKSEAPSLMDGDVREYLLEHPDFLVANSDLLAVLIPPARTLGGDIKDFQHFMLTNLQENAEKYKGDHDHMQQVMQEHLHRQSRFNVAALTLLEAPSLKALLKIIENDLPLLLDHEAVVIMAEEGGEPLPGIPLVEEGFVRHWLPKRDVVLEGNIEGSAELYGIKGVNVRSQAIVRLAISPDVPPPGLLAFGHRDPNYYATGLATEQVLHLTSIVELCIRKWLSLRA